MEIITDPNIYCIPNHLQICKPKYLMLIEHLLPIEESIRFKYTPPFPDWFHLTIRAIFDSKYYEMLYKYYADYQTSSSFPGWLNRICLFLVRII